MVKNENKEKEVVKLLKLTKFDVVEKVFKRLFMLDVYAEEGEGEKEVGGKDDDQPLNIAKILQKNTEDLKKQLRGQIEVLKKEVASLKQANNKLYAENADVAEKLEQALEADEKGKELEKVKTQLAELKKAKEDLEKSLPKEEEIRKKLEAEYAVKLYIKEVLTANKDDILSTFADEVTGSTKEEVDKAVEAVKAKTAQVKKDLGIEEDEDSNKDVDEAKEGAEKKTKKKKEKDPPAETPPVINPVLNTVGGVKPEDVRKMTQEEYKEFRKKVGLK